MLVGDGWAFVHIAKCAGTTTRSILSGREVAEVMPEAAKTCSAHPYHMIGRERPPGRVFTFIRHPVGWMRSYYDMRLHEGHRNPEKALDALWSDNPDQWALRVCEAMPGHVGRLFDAYIDYCTEVHTLLKVHQVLRSIVRHGIPPRKLNRQRYGIKFKPATVKAIEATERDIIQRYWP